MSRRFKVCSAELQGTSVDECVAQLLERLPARFAVAGLSLGGVVAMALVRQAPHRVSGLALLSSNPRAPTSQQLRSWSRTRSALRSGTSARQVQAELLPVLLSEPAGRGPLAAEVLAMADEVGVKRLDDQLAMQVTRVDERPSLAGVRVPTLVIAGAADTMVPADWHLEVARLVPSARVVVLEGVGHLSPVEAPAAVAQSLIAWLAGQE